MGAMSLRTPLRFIDEVQALVRGGKKVVTVNGTAYMRACAGELPDPLPEKVGYLLQRNAYDSSSIDSSRNAYWEVVCVYDLGTLEPVLPVGYESDAYSRLADSSVIGLACAREQEMAELGAAALGRAWRQARERLELADDVVLVGMLNEWIVPRETSRQAIEQRYLKSGTTSYDRDEHRLRDATRTEQLLALYAPEALEGTLAEQDKRDIAYDVLSERSWRRAEATYADETRASLKGLRRLAASLEGVGAKTVRVVFSEEDPKGLVIERERLRRGIVCNGEVPRSGWSFTPSLDHSAQGEAVAVRSRGKDVWAA